MARAQSSPPTEYQVKAAFLFNFAKFVDWPPNAFAKTGDSLVICVLGEDPFGSLLEETIEGKSVSGKKMVARRLAGIEETANCHVLFISSSEEGRLTAVLKTLAGKSILTVGEMDQFAKRGGAIGFELEANRVRFEINLKATEQARLTVSSQLLKLARVVSHNPRGSN